MTFGVLSFAGYTLLPYALDMGFFNSKSFTEKLTTFHPDSNTLCNQCKAETGSLFHTFCTCLKLQPYWTYVLETLSKVYEVKQIPSTLTAVFGVIFPSVSIPKNHSDAIAFASLIVRRLILLRWKEEAPSTHGLWIADIEKIIH